jgi:hypothetical protein
VNKAGKRLAARGDLDMVKRLETDKASLQKKMYPIKDLADERDKRDAIKEVELAIKQQQDENTIEAAKQALLYGSGYTTAAALTGQALESIRRDMGRED